MAIKTARQVNNERNIYADVATSFTVHPVKKDIVPTRNENAIRQSIKNLLLTDRGERLFQPNVGSDIRALLFENISPQTEVALKKRIYNTIETFEPRCKLVDVKVSGDLDRNAYNVAVFYYTINSEEALKLDFVLDRVR